MKRTPMPRRAAPMQRSPLERQPLAAAYTRQWLAESGFDLEGYITELERNPKRAGYAAELRVARDPATGEGSHA